MGTVLRMVLTLLLLVISTALAAPRVPQDSMEASEDNSDNSVDYSGGSEDNFSDNSGNYTDFLDGAIFERSNSHLEDRAINTCGCAPVSSSNRIVGGKEVNPKGKLPYQVFFQGCAGMRGCSICGGTIGWRPNDQQPQQPRQCTLKETIVKLLKGSDPMCSKYLKTSSSKIKLCAFAKDTDACQGDSGGPLTVPENGKYTLVGVVSYGSGCASSTPGGYVRVQGFLPWIKNLISSGECSGSSSASSGGATTAKPTSAKPTPTASSNGNGNDYYSYYG